MDDFSYITKNEKKNYDVFISPPNYKSMWKQQDQKKEKKEMSLFSALPTNRKMMWKQKNKTKNHKTWDQTLATIDFGWFFEFDPLLFSLITHPFVVPPLAPCLS